MTKKEMARKQTNKQCMLMIPFHLKAQCIFTNYILAPVWKMTNSAQ